ncbi:MAG TPA: hypothetical protein VD948_04305 [Rhodothermales bacterium]|nr:hypothetical protein [Rhodothermales bacterium]
MTSLDADRARLRRVLWALVALALAGYGGVGIALGRIVPPEAVVARAMGWFRLVGVLRGDPALAAGLRCVCLGGVLYLWKVHEDVISRAAQGLRLVGIATLVLLGLATYLVW